MSTNNVSTNFIADDRITRHPMHSCHRAQRSIHDICADPTNLANHGVYRNVGLMDPVGHLRYRIAPISPV